MSWMAPRAASTRSTPSVSKARVYSRSCRRVAAVAMDAEVSPPFVSATKRRPLRVTMKSARTSQVSTRPSMRTSRWLEVCASSMVYPAFSRSFTARASPRLPSRRCRAMRWRTRQAAYCEPSQSPTRSRPATRSQRRGVGMSCTGSLYGSGSAPCQGRPARDHVRSAFALCSLP